jgi:hypothetical protein
VFISKNWRCGRKEFFSRTDAEAQKVRENKVLENSTKKMIQFCGMGILARP